MQHPPTADTVHVWRIALDPPADAVAELARLLDEAELARSDRFAAPRERARYIVSHAALRSILARYVRGHAADLRFDTAERGRPRLHGRADAPRFSLSHSGDVAVVAVAARIPVGVDAEHVRPVRRLLRIARRYFAPAEFRRLRDVADEDERVRMFFRFWTRKEAFLKALGCGIAGGLGRFDVRAIGRDGETAAVDGETVDLARWTVRPLELRPGYAGAVAAGVAGCVIDQFDWSVPADRLRLGG